MQWGNAEVRMLASGMSDDRLEQFALIKGADNCSGRGLVDSGFATTPTKGVSGYVAHRGPAGLKR